MYKDGAGYANFIDQYSHPHFPEIKGKYKLSNDYLFFWSKCRVWSLDLNKMSGEPKFRLREIPIWKSDKQNDDDSIIDVRVGNGKYIAIVIQ